MERKDPFQSPSPRSRRATPTNRRVARAAQGANSTACVDFFLFCCWLVLLVGWLVLFVCRRVCGAGTNCDILPASEADAIADKPEVPWFCCFSAMSEEQIISADVRSVLPNKCRDRLAVATGEEIHHAAKQLPAFGTPTMRCVLNKKLSPKHTKAQNRLEIRAFLFFAKQNPINEKAENNNKMFGLLAVALVVLKQFSNRSGSSRAVPISNISGSSPAPPEREEQGEVDAKQFM